MRCELFDAGSVLTKVPWMDTPGMENAYFRAMDMEYQFPATLQNQINSDLITTPVRTDLLPWPEKFPNRCWIDWTPRYEGEDGGLQIGTLRYDFMSARWNFVPAEMTQIPTDASYSPVLNPNDTRIADAKTVAEVAAEGEHPTEWLRLPLYNEQGGKDYGYCQLESPTSVVQNFHQSNEYRFVVNYSPLFAPVDLTHPEWYQAVNSDGVPVPDRDRWLSMRPDGRYRLYLRPANWRWTVTVWANYLYVSFFEMFTTRLIFTTAYFDRPPIYPRRHDLIHTTQTADWEYMGNMYSTDAGISWAFDLSRGAMQLRHEIIDSQWWTQSEAFIFLNNEQASIAMWLWPPEPGDIVFGLGQVDNATGHEQVIWFKQVVDLTDEYPRTVIGSYAVPEFAVTR